MLYTKQTFHLTLGVTYLDPMIHVDYTRKKNTSHTLLYLACEQNGVWSQITPKEKTGSDKARENDAQGLETTKEMCTGDRQLLIEYIGIGVRQL